MTTWVQRLLVANVIMFFLSMTVPGVMQVLALVPALIPRRPWTVLTYMFLHAGLAHIAFNMLALYFFGPRLEARLGSSRFLALYLISGLVAAAASAIMTPYAAVVGASGAVYGVMLGFARYWPTDPVHIWGVLPVPARWLVIGMTVLSFWGGFGGGGGRVAHFAHLGGFLGGFLYLAWVDRRSAAAQFRKKAAPPSGPSRSTPDEIARWSRIRLDDLHPVNREEAERLLQKAMLGGTSLTPDERAFLNRMSAG